MNKNKKRKNLILVIMSLLVFVICLMTFISCQLKNPKKRPLNSTEYFFEAEDATITNCTAFKPEAVNVVERNECVGYLTEGSKIDWTVNSEKQQENVPLRIKLSCPMAWVGVHNLPQTFSFDKVYTLKVNGEEIKISGDLYGSSDVTNSGNYYYWVNAETDVLLKQGENIISIEVTNLGKRTYACFGNIDYISFLSVCELK